MSDDVDGYADSQDSHDAVELEDELPAAALAEAEYEAASQEDDDDVNELVATGAEEEDEVEEDAEPIEFKFRQCVHKIDEKRPKLTKETQRHTKQIIGHVTKRMKASAGFRKLLRLVALREASYQSGLVHRLQPDVEGSLSAWRKMSKRYANNPYADDQKVWQTYGLFGMNSNYFTMLWDREGDPRTLCDPVVDIIVYKRSAERALRKLNGTIRCRDANGETFDYRTSPTWATIHRAVNGGKLCPSKREDQAAIMRKYFNARAGRIGLDPDQHVTAKMLGVEPEQGLDGEEWETQEEMVMGLWNEIEALEEES